MSGAYVHITPEKTFTHYHSVLARLTSRRTPPEGRVLDIGCGFGHLLELVHAEQPSLELVGADAFEECVAATQKRVPSARVVRVREDQGDLAELGNAFDTCVMAHSLEHMPNPIEAIGRALDCLKPGGHLILAVPNPVRPTVFFGNIRRKNYANRGHIYAWDRSHWMNFLERVLGLEVVEYASDEVKLFSWRVLRVAPVLKRVEIALSRWVPWWSFSNIAVVRKAE